MNMNEHRQHFKQPVGRCVYLRMQFVQPIQKKGTTNKVCKTVWKRVRFTPVYSPHLFVYNYHTLISIALTLSFLFPSPWLAIDYVNCNVSSVSVLVVCVCIWQWPGKLLLLMTGRNNARRRCSRWCTALLQPVQPVQLSAVVRLSTATTAAALLCTLQLKVESRRCLNFKRGAINLIITSF